MSKHTFDYGILVQNALVKDLQNKPQNQRTALLGLIVKIEGVLGNKTFAIRFLKSDNSEHWESNKFCCDQSIIVPVNENLWPYLASVSSPQERVLLAKNPNRCEQLMQTPINGVVGFLDFGQVLLGTIKFKGNIKGIGKGFGIQLYEKKINNNCNGTCAGIQYFECLPGFGIFTTIERIVPRNVECATVKSARKLSATLLDNFTEKNVADISINLKECDAQKKNHISESKFKNDTQTQNRFRTSHSMQNILDPKSTSTNANNDFDQNTIIQPDNTNLIHEGGSNKIDMHRTEIDLIDAIGGTWSDTLNHKELERPHLKKPYEKTSRSEFYVPCDTTHSALNVTPTKPRNKSINPVSHLINGSKTVPRKVKFFQEPEKTVNKSAIGSKNGEVDIKLNRSNPDVKASPTVPIHYNSPTPGTTNDLTVGSLVEIINTLSPDPLYGVIRWLGIEPNSSEVLVGVELEEEQIHLPLKLADGTHNGQRLFECAENRSIFVPLNQCHKDPRFAERTQVQTQHVPEKVFGVEVDCPIVKGAVAPLCMPTEEDVEAVCGKFRGIQGHHNSCYLDATLFAMFTFTAVFDSLLFRPKGPGDIPYYEEVQQVLREEIVNPLRTNLFVRADRVMNLRKLLDQFSSVSGLTSEEKDPEEFLNSLLAQILKAEPFLKLNSGQETYHYQLFVEKDDGLTLPTVQQLFEQSFLTSDIKLKEVPSCLIIQMPRFGKNFKMYPRILPSQVLDVTDVIENSPRQCTVCGKVAKWECKECFGECGEGLESTAFCTLCIEKVHSHSRRQSHSPKKISVLPDFSIMADHCQPPRLFMELFAVICIETSHYVAFVKCGVGHEAPWCFFDSMADRKGEQNGYNIPEMVACPDVSKWLSDEQSCRALHESAPLDRYLPEHARRLLCDAFICMYQSPDVMMYR
ncbi:hypothetical protein PPYR_09484 [Photinus pyralis]|uniref:ubiquitinyl hydrolase 1 n=1 Tax=Photinus pyralis TaxID=7054 RepID=A0A1Y1N7I8_PHOPY|nr:ubiquitin carboxyl-terminal hydrolase CYLD [Photinus pyralis]KAB0798491.1 hypothetical protein PPYR_09484 [Photinus pyralis]